MAEITLADLLAWEPRLRLAAAGVGDAGGTGRPPASLTQELTWAVTARAMPPMLPLLRGGELVLLPRRVLADAGVALPILLRELVGHEVVGVVIEETAPPAPPLPVLVIDPMPADLEGEINRLLTQRRGEIYRAGTELGRLLTTLTTAGAEINQIVATAAKELDAPLAVVDARRNLLTHSGSATDPFWSRQEFPAEDDRLSVPLATGDILLLGPVPESRRALARLTVDRVAVAVEAALAQVERQRPRGPARASALAALLTVSGPTTDASAAAQAHALGLGLDTDYRVVLAAPTLSVAVVRRALAPLGTVNDAGEIDSALAFLVELPPSRATERTSRSASRPTTAPRRETLSAQPSVSRPTDWLALSQPVAGAAGLPAAAREARYVAALLAAGLITGPMARFDAIADLGAFRLLYRLWGTPELVTFVEEALGDLPAQDRRGTLRDTLLSYLNAGGSHVAAAASLGIHRNTLAYRLKQIAGLTGQDPDDPATRLLLHLALLAASLPPPPSL